MANRLTQIATEALTESGNPHVRLTQIAREALQQPSPTVHIRLTQAAVETLVQISPPGTISSLIPSSGWQGTTVYVTVTGAYTHFVPGVTTVTMSGTGISVGTVNVLSPTSLIVPLTMASGATLGPYTMTVTSGSEAPTATFTVTLGHQRGDIDYDQIRAVARLGYGSLIQMAGSSQWYMGHTLVYDAYGNAVDGGASPAYSIRLISANTFMTSSDYTVVATAPSITVTLPSTPPTGQIVNVKNGNSTSGQLITVAGAGTSLIDQSNTLSLGATASLMVQWDGTQWRIL